MCLVLHYAERHIGTDIKAITTADIFNYYQYLQKRPNRTNGDTLRQKTAIDFIKTIQELYLMLQETNQIETNPASMLELSYPRQESLRMALTQEEITLLYSSTESYLEKAILALGYGCGLRVNEMVQCNIADINLREAVLLVKQGKGNKSRIVPLSKTVQNDLSNYLYKTRLHEDTTEKEAFILHSRQGRMQNWTYNKLLKQLIAKTENYELIEKQISMHHLRHSIATHLIEQGMALEQVRQFLGHSHLESTEIYTHISKTQLQNLNY